MMGCVYSDAVMEKVRRLGAGVMETANSLTLERKPETAPKKTPIAPAPTQPSTAANPPREPPPQHRNSVRMNSEDTYTEEKMKQIRLFLLQADYRASAMEMLNHATGRARSPWTQNVSDGVMRISIANVLVLEQKFTQPNVNSTEGAVNAIVETFLHGGNVSIKNKQLHFNGCGPQDLYYNFLKRCLKKAEKLASGAKTFKALLAALEKVNLELSQHSTHLQGWSQKVDIRIGDLLASSRVLSKGECVRAKLDKAIDDMCARISDATDEEDLEGEDEAEGSQCDFRQTAGFTMPCGIGALAYSRGEMAQPTFFQHHLLSGGNEEIEDFCPSPMKVDELERKLARKVDIPLIFFGDSATGNGGVDPCEDGGKTLRDSLRKIGLALPAGRRKQANVTAWTALVEEEAVHMAKDFALVCEKEFHAREIGIFLTKTGLSIDHDVMQRRTMLENSKKIVSELCDLLAADRTPLTPFVAPTRPLVVLDPSIQQHLSHYTLMTHGFGGVAMVAVLESVKSMIDESIKYLDRNCSQPMYIPYNTR
ncbi:transcription factor AP-2 [Teladorsagia circumcincta]|uniref:Transcription factor AP-2 n=1 Tax=Teladorsagia circumcincta TaxID=45464 RepID=A0A2G9UBX6_TELCI|nr:transcription factor AP-2 [Teladorsagia circumcincta]